ncbi:unnamed protein product, partial [Ectocarpus fasciculatus]
NVFTAVFSWRSWRDFPPASFQYMSATPEPTICLPPTPTFENHKYSLVCAMQCWVQRNPRCSCSTSYAPLKYRCLLATTPCIFPSNHLLYSSVCHPHFFFSVSQKQ